MKKNIFNILTFLILIFALLYINMFFIMYNIKVKNVENGTLILEIFNNDFVYEYEERKI